MTSNVEQQTLHNYLTTYDPSDYPVILVTVDTVLLTFDDNQIKVLLVKRANLPEIGKWGLPGGFLNTTRDESLEAAASRSVKEKTGVNPSYLEQVGTTGNAERDPRGWSISVVYSALMPYQSGQQHVESVSEVAWVAVNHLDTSMLAFDHLQLINATLQRYKQKALYSFLPAFGLQQPFTLTELRKVHELLIGKTIQRKSFIRRVEASQVLEETNEFRQERGRPAKLYRATPAVVDYRFVRNIED